jgi:hypothetical protein
MVTICANVKVVGEAFSSIEFSNISLTVEKYQNIQDTWMTLIMGEIKSLKMQLQGVYLRVIQLEISLILLI